MNNIVAILPAAGHSRRMGVPKPMLRWKGLSFLEIIVRHLSAREIPAYVVHRPDQEVLANLIEDMAERGLDVRSAVNPLPESEMVDSVAFALRKLNSTMPAWKGSLIWPPDCPAVDPADLDRILEAALGSPQRPVVPNWEGKRGHPTYFPKQILVALMKADLPYPGTLRDLLDQAEPPVEIEASGKGVVLNLNDPGALAELQRLQDNPTTPEPAIDCLR